MKVMYKLQKRSYLGQPPIIIKVNVLKLTDKTVTYIKKGWGVPQKQRVNIESFDHEVFETYEEAIELAAKLATGNINKLLKELKNANDHADAVSKFVETDCTDFTDLEIPEKS